MNDPQAMEGGEEKILHISHFGITQVTSRARTFLWFKKRLQSPKSHDKLQTPVGLNPTTYKSSSIHSETLEFQVEGHGHCSFSNTYFPPIILIVSRKSFWFPK